MQIQNYYQIQTQPDRRQQAIPVEFDRRSGLDRRANTRFVIDSKLDQDINSVKSVFVPTKNDKGNDLKQDVAEGLLSTIPFGRRIDGISEALHNHDYIKGAGKAFLQFINVHEDSRDLKNAASQLFCFNFSKDAAQIPFSFIRGTFLEKDNSLGRMLYRYDKTLFDVPVMRKFIDKMNINILPIITEDIDKFGAPIIKYEIEGGFLPKILAKAMLRIPVLSLAFLSILEISSILKSDNPFKQTCKSAINVGSISAGGAILGAVGRTKFGMIGSLLGLGLGSFLGDKVSKDINEHI